MFTNGCFCTYKISVEREEDKRVNGHVGGHVDQVLDDLAPEVVQGPADGVVDRRGRDARHDEQQIGRCQILEMIIC